VSTRATTAAWAPLPPGRPRYPSEVAKELRRCHSVTARQLALARQRALHGATAEILEGRAPSAARLRAPDDATRRRDLKLARGTDTEERSQIDRRTDFHFHKRDGAQAALSRRRNVVAPNGKTFAELMRAARACSLGQIADTFFEVGGQYRRNV
jgi:hypothetical protein